MARVLLAGRAVRPVNTYADAGESRSFGPSGCHTAVMGYVLGSQVESMTVTETGTVYQPAGVAHAVDLESELNSAKGQVGYAVCGTAVRVWPDRPFEPGAAEAHDRCVEIVAATSRDERRQR